MPNGSLFEYLREHPDVDKLGLVRGYLRHCADLLMTQALYRYQLLDIAQGLAYLHQYNVVHGNLTGVGLILSFRDEGADNPIAQYPGGRRWGRLYFGVRSRGCPARRDFFQVDTNQCSMDGTGSSRRRGQTRSVRE